MRFFNNKLAAITGFRFSVKVDYFNLSMLLRKRLFTWFLCQSMCVIIYIEAKAKYAGNFKKLSTENVFSTTYLSLKGYIVESKKSFSD